MNRFVLIAALGLCLTDTYAQQNKLITDTVFQINEVTVTSNRLNRFAPGIKVQKVDNLLMQNYASQNLSDLLLFNSQVQVNAYGNGGLSNVSLRGTGSAHTAVLWNGFNLQDMFNGGCDFSLLPVFFIDNISIQYGGTSALFGSGSIGGAIHLNNKFDINKGLNAKILSGYGSFDNFSEGGTFSYSNNWYSGSIKFFYNSTQNNFSFKNTEQDKSPTMTLPNGKHVQGGILAGNSFQLNAQNKLETYFWYQDNDKHVAPTMDKISANNDSINDKQHDKAYRASVNWKNSGNNHTFSLRSAINDQYMDYNTYHSNYHSITSSNEALYDFFVSKNHSFNGGANYILEHAISNQFTQNHTRHRSTLFGSYRFSSNDNRLTLAGNIRGEMINKRLTPATFSTGFEFLLMPFLSIKGNIATNYRVPSFNDLYWPTGGNPNLINESGICTDLGLTIIHDWNVANIKYEINAYSNRVKDWILWQPTSENASIWKPENLSHVWARGIENDVTFTTHIDQLRIKNRLSYSYTASTKSKEDYAGDAEYQKQLIYVPHHKALLAIALDYKLFNLSFTEQYTGRRYTSKDNKHKLDPYTIGTLNVSKKISFNRNFITIGLTINNLWNSVYQVMPYYPMPLQNYLLNLQLNLK